MTFARTAIALAASYSWPIYQIDVKNTFLNGDLIEVVYMKPPKGLSVPSSDSVCKLKQSIYGLRHAPRTWFTKFQGTILLAGFQHGNFDPSMFLQITTNGITILPVYVNDILITGDDSHGIQYIQYILRVISNKRS